MRIARIALVVAVVPIAACTSDGAVPIDQVQTTTTQFLTHLVEPSDQMRELAEQQCLDDPTLDQGLIEAVDPTRPDVVISSIAVDCAEVRG